MRGDDALRPCAGTCRRITRPRNRLIKDNPGTVVRWDGDMCKSCATGVPPRTVEMAQVDREEYDARQEKIKQERQDAAFLAAERLRLDRERRAKERARRQRITTALQLAGVRMR